MYSFVCVFDRGCSLSMDLSKFVHAIPDFPKKGILFQDLSPLFANPGAFSIAIDRMLGMFDLKNIDAFAGVESRGFILASAMAIRSMKGFVLIRKAGKLPPPVNQLSYDLEYGKGTLEMKKGSGRLILIDDVLATGGTIAAGLQLSQQSGYEVADVGFLMNIKKLNQFSFGSSAVPKAILTME